jgi:predicted transcriptional regulator
MATLWAAPSALTVREVLERLNGGGRATLAYTTVMTVMARLADKGVLRRERAGRGYRYVPVVRDTAGIAVREVVRSFGETAVAPFVEEARNDPRLLRRLRTLLEQEP